MPRLLLIIVNVVNGIIVVLFLYFYNPRPTLPTAIHLEFSCLTPPPLILHPAFPNHLYITSVSIAFISTSPILSGLFVRFVPWFMEIISFLFFQKIWKLRSNPVMWIWLIHFSLAQRNLFIYRNFLYLKQMHYSGFTVEFVCINIWRRAVLSVIIIFEFSIISVAEIVMIILEISVCLQVQGEGVREGESETTGAAAPSERGDRQLHFLSSHHWLPRVREAHRQEYVHSEVRSQCLPNRRTRETRLAVIHPDTVREINVAEY